MDNSFEQKLEKVLKNNPDFISEEGEILKERVIDSAYKADRKLIESLLENAELKKKFFSEIKGHWVFNINDFVMFIQDKHFLNDSYTQYKNKIGLTIGGKFLNERKEVALVWPFKDTVLEGGMTKEDQKKKEIFFNEILAQDEIDKLFAPKVLTNWKRYTAKGKEEVKELKRDENGTIKENLIIKGNNLLALHTLKEQFRGKVKLIYIDPPFNTEGDSFMYNDKFSHSTWLTFIKNRLEIARDLLSDDGSIFMHLDWNESHYGKIILDEVFGRENFLNEIVWRYGAGGNPKNFFPRKHDVILWYGKKGGLNQFYKDQEIMKVPYSESTLTTHFKNVDQHGRRYRIQTVNGKEYVTYADIGKLVTDVWTDIGAQSATSPISSESVDFSGQKPEELLYRIIAATTKTGDLVCDFFSGSGTTATVAHKLKRQWIACEQIDSQVTIGLDRIRKVLTGTKEGISKNIDWKGGGDFVYCELMKYNESFVEEIENAKDIKAFLKIWEQMKEKAFFNYNFEMQEFEKNIEEFKKLDLEKQKQVLFSMLDKNQLYVNYSEIEDKKFKVEKKDKEINKEFYGNN
jgi:adenine-specific DNA-methyltransferase